MKVSDHLGKKSKEISDDRIFYADIDTHYAMFIANVNIFCPSMKQKLELNDFHIGFSSSEELLKVCNSLLDGYIFTKKKHENHILWESPSPFAIVLISIDLLDGRGEKVVCESLIPSEKSFSYATYQAILHSKQVKIPPWLATVEIFVHLTEIGQHQFSQLIHTSSNMHKKH